MGDRFPLDSRHDASRNSVATSFSASSVCNCAGVLGVSGNDRNDDRSGELSPAQSQKGESRNRAAIDEALSRIRRVLEEFGDQPSAVARDARIESLKDYARYLYRVRRKRDGLYRDLFADPAWDMMLDLFVGQSDQYLPSVTSVCIAACVPATTALRWITLMLERSIITKSPDPFDRRRSFIALTPEAYAYMVDYLQRALADDPRHGPRPRL